MTVTTWKSVGSEIGCLTNLIIARLYGLAMGLCHWREGIFFTPMDRMDRMGFWAWIKGMDGDFGFSYRDGFRLADDILGYLDGDGAD